MISVNRDFNDRVSEIEQYFSFLGKVMVDNCELLYSSGTKESFSNDLSKIFIANSFLLLYNLAESSIKNAVEEIHTSITNESVEYDDLLDCLKIEIIKNVKSNVSSKKFVNDVNVIARDIIIKSFNPDNILSGNLDARKIKALAGSYGFSSSVMPLNRNGAIVGLNSSHLLTVKTRRNDLAHGIYSFRECGRNYTYYEIVDIKDHVIEYLRQTLASIEKYVLNKEYLSAV